MILNAIVLWGFLAGLIALADYSQQSKEGLLVASYLVLMGCSVVLFKSTLPLIVTKIVVTVGWACLATALWFVVSRHRPLMSWVAAGTLALCVVASVMVGW